MSGSIHPKMAIMALVVTFLLLALAAQTEAKMCYEECNDLGQIKSVDIRGCRRRSGRHGRTPRFRCDGMAGPPCTIKRGDTVDISVDFKSDPSYVAITQKVVWVTSFGIELPWAGMDPNVCNYTGNPCGSSEMTADFENLNYPIHIMKVYPQGKYNLKWTITGKKSDGSVASLGCLRFTIKIV